MLVRCSLLACCSLALGFPAAVLGQTSAQPAQSKFEVKGVVTDISRAPVASADVAAVAGGSLVRQTQTRDDGSFSLAAVPAGPMSLRIQRIGFEARTIEVQVGSESLARLDIVLKPTATELEDVLISVNDMSRLREFYDHRAHRSGFARFYDQEEIGRKGATYSSDLFRSMPGIVVKASNIGGNTIRIRGCQPMVWVDGQRVPHAELDEVVTPSDIAGIEFYTSMAGTPAQYLERSNRACGTVLVWTRNR